MEGQTLPVKTPVVCCYVLFLVATCDTMLCSVVTGLLKSEAVVVRCGYTLSRDLLTSPVATGIAVCVSCSSAFCQDDLV